MVCCPKGLGDEKFLPNRRRPVASAFFLKVLADVEPQDLGLLSSEYPSSHAGDFSAVLAQLRKSSGVDFSQYKPNTIHRGHCAVCCSSK